MKIPLPTKYDLIIASIIFVIFIIVGNLFNFDNYPKPGNGKEYFMPNLYKKNKGIITNKYIGKNNHASKTIEFIVNDTIEYYYNLDWDSELYDYIKIKDSILKTEFGNKIIIRRNKIDSLFKLKLKGYE